MRRQNIKHVGLSEVNLALLDQNLQDILNGSTTIKKPLVNFNDDKITQEKTKLEGISVVIVEGTYTTTLSNAHKYVFIDRTYVDTKETRKYRLREEQDGFLEKVLKIEHSIISTHRDKADIIITNSYEVRCNEATQF